MTIQKIAATNAVVFFFFWILVLLVGADFPPPLGFLWIIVTVVCCSAIVYWRVPTYIDWSRTSQPNRYLRIVLDGIVAGLIIALLFMLLGTGEPSVAMRLFDYGIWFTVLAIMGVLNAVTIYAINAVVARYFL
ncbi:MAG: hypothetical protein CSA11_01745 [Chloroflexi bacterium]|nr:MAG: hypothetical protein CSA11_01745 [Chloroflexota bacterium]